MTDSWTVFPHLVVRTTGFSFDLLEELRCRESAAIARDLVRHRLALETYKATAPRISRPPKAVLSALKAGREIAASEVEDPAAFSEWNRLASAVRQAEAAFEDRYTSEQRRAVSALEQLTQDPRLREAVASSSPPVFVDLARGRLSSRVERQLASYLQRVCAKNETMSFFGPINYGSLQPEADDGLELSWSGPGRCAAGTRTSPPGWRRAWPGASRAIRRSLPGWCCARRGSRRRRPAGRPGCSLARC